MLWRNLTQYGFADAALSSHESLKEIDDVHQIFDWPEVESLLSSLYASKRGNLLSSINDVQSDAAPGLQ